MAYKDTGNIKVDVKSPTSEKIQSAMESILKNTYSNHSTGLAMDTSWYPSSPGLNIQAPKKEEEKPVEFSIYLVIEHGEAIPMMGIAVASYLSSRTDLTNVTVEEWAHTDKGKFEKI